MGGHLWAEDGIIFAHLLCEDNTLHIGRDNGALYLLLFPHADRGDQGTDTDARSPRLFTSSIFRQV